MNFYIVVMSINLIDKKIFVFIFTSDKKSYSITNLGNFKRKSIAERIIMRFFVSFVIHFMKNKKHLFEDSSSLKVIFIDKYF